jgi:hypothetical protein
MTTELWVAGYIVRMLAGFAFASVAFASSESNCRITRPCASIFDCVVAHTGSYFVAGSLPARQTL